MRDKHNDDRVCLVVWRVALLSCCVLNLGEGKKKKTEKPVSVAHSAQESQKHKYVLSKCHLHGMHRRMEEWMHGALGSRSMKTKKRGNRCQGNRAATQGQDPDPFIILANDGQETL